MEQEISERSCRVCLQVLPEDAPTYTEKDGQNYKILTGFSFQSFDIPRKICERCRDLLKSLVQLRAEALAVEEKLARSLQKIELKQEVAIVEEVSAFFCDLCSRSSYSSVKALKSHMRRKHLKSPKTYECFYCSEAFSTYKERLDHSKLRHGTKSDKKRTFVCAQCGRFFSSLYSLERHQETHDGLVYSCDLCPNGPPIRGKVKLYDHMRYRHIASKTASSHCCETCDRTFKSRGAKKLHVIRNHTDKSLWPYKCKTCHRTFARLQSFKDHERRHLGIRTHECGQCGDRFVNRTHLVQHQRCVHESQDLHCPFCSKNFGSSKYLKQHLKTHEMAYQCPICPNKTFSLTTTLRSHVKQHHPSFPLPAPGTVLKNYDWSEVSK